MAQLPNLGGLHLRREAVAETGMPATLRSASTPLMELLGMANNTLEEETRMEALHALRERADGEEEEQRRFFSTPGIEVLSRLAQDVGDEAALEALHALGFLVQIPHITDEEVQILIRYAVPACARILRVSGESALKKSYAAWVMSKMSQVNKHALYTALQGTNVQGELAAMVRDGLSNAKIHAVTVLGNLAREDGQAEQTIRDEVRESGTIPAIVAMISEDAPSVQTDNAAYAIATRRSSVVDMKPFSTPPQTPQPPGIAVVRSARLTS